MLTNLPLCVCMPPPNRLLLSRAQACMAMDITLTKNGWRDLCYGVIIPEIESPREPSSETVAPPVVVPLPPTDGRHLVLVEEEAPASMQPPPAEHEKETHEDVPQGPHQKARESEVCGNGPSLFIRATNLPEYHKPYLS